MPPQAIEALRLPRNNTVAQKALRGAHNGLRHDSRGGQAEQMAENPHLPVVPTLTRRMGSRKNGSSTRAERGTVCGTEVHKESTSRPRFTLDAVSHACSVLPVTFLLVLLWGWRRAGKRLGVRRVVSRARGVRRLSGPAQTKRPLLGIRAYELPFCDGDNAGTGWIPFVEGKGPLGSRRVTLSLCGDRPHIQSPGSTSNDWP
jgi:hypothetical protein